VVVVEMVLAVVVVIVVAAALVAKLIRQYKHYPVLFFHANNKMDCKAVIVFSYG
jgi:hypothetical protein